MPKRDSTDLKTRMRIAAWLRYEMETLEISQAQLAKKIGVGPGALSRALKGGAIGLDLVIGVNRGLSFSANRLLNDDPPGKYWVAKDT